MVGRSALAPGHPDGRWRFDGRGWRPIDPPAGDWLSGCAVALVAHALAIVVAIVIAVLAVTATVYLVILVSSRLAGHG